MVNISIQGEDIILSTDKTYFVMDALYFNEIKLGIDRLVKGNIENEIKEKIFPFPYTDTPFVKVRLNDEKFDVHKIQKLDYDSLTQAEKAGCFSTDSGLIVFVADNLLLEFASTFSYDELVDSDRECLITIIGTSLRKNIIEMTWA